MSQNRFHTLWLLALQVKWCPRVFPFIHFESWHVAKFHVICKVENTFTFCEMTSNSVSVSELTPQVSLYLQSGKHFHFLWNGVQQCNVSFRSVLKLPSFTLSASVENTFTFPFLFLWNDVQQCFCFKVDFPSFTLSAKWKTLSLSMKWCPTVNSENWLAKLHFICKIKNTFTFTFHEMVSNSAVFPFVPF